MTVKGSVGLTQAERSAESSQRLMDSAIALIAEKGFEKTTAAEIGERAGYSRAMVRARYGTKEALLEGLLHSEFEPMFFRTGVSADSGLETVLGQLEFLADHAAKKPELLRAFFTLCFETVGPVRGLSEWMRGWLAHYRTTTGTAFAQGQEDGSIRPELDAEVESRRMVTYGLGLGFRWTLEPDHVDFCGELMQWHAELRSRYATGRSRSNSSSRNTSRALPHAKRGTKRPNDS